MQRPYISEDNLAAQTIFETDWLASTPVFFNTKTYKASTNIRQVMPSIDDFCIHPEGIYNYIDFGYSVFGQTLVDNVKFMPPASGLIRTNSGNIKLVQDIDPIEQWRDYRLSESDIIELIRERVQAWEASLPSDQLIVLPLSGGYDSRLLLWCLRDPERVRAYTYGLSTDQSMSTEVVRARELAKRFKIRWEQIQLSDFHRFFDNWDAEFGLSTHAHGMYHFEFYTKIRQEIKGKHAFLSGIFGDVWAGSIPQHRLKDATRLVDLGYTHGMRADPTKLRLSASHEIRESFWAKHQSQLNDHRFQVVTTIRLKIMLISYLMRVPRLFDFQPWTPYLDIDIAMAMLNLPQERRRNRQWQRDFFRKVGLDLEQQRLGGTQQNNLNIQAIRRIPLKPLDKNLLAQIFEPSYVEWINNHARITQIGGLHRSILMVPKIGGILRKIGLGDRTLPAYFAYLCLRPIETYLHQRIIDNNKYEIRSGSTGCT